MAEPSAIRVPPVNEIWNGRGEREQGGEVRMQISSVLSEGKPYWMSRRAPGRLISIIGLRHFRMRLGRLPLPRVNKFPQR